MHTTCCKKDSMLATRANVERDATSKPTHRRTAAKSCSRTELSRHPRPNWHPDAERHEPPAVDDLMFDDCIKLLEAHILEDVSIDELFIFPLPGLSGR